MEIFNTLLLIATAIIAILNLLVEVEDTTVIKNEIYFRIGFGGVAVIALMGTTHILPILCYIVNMYVLLGLAFRLRVRIKSLHNS